MQPIYMIIGCPGSGKSWITSQLADKYELVHHDLYIGMAGDTYVREILKAARTASRPLLIEAPFSISSIKDPLEKAGHRIIPIFIQEKDSVVSQRYREREKKPIPQGPLTRMKTYRQRCLEWKSFMGTSQECLEHLRNQA